jgi:hypothetical protein
MNSAFSHGSPGRACMAHLVVHAWLTWSCMHFSQNISNIRLHLTAQKIYIQASKRNGHPPSSLVVVSTGSLGIPRPMLFTADTRNSYTVNGVRPVTSYSVLVTSPTSRHASSLEPNLGRYSTTYDVDKSAGDGARSTITGFQLRRMALAVTSDTDKPVGDPGRAAAAYNHKLTAYRPR